MSTLRAPDHQAFLHKPSLPKLLPSGRASVTAIAGNRALHGCVGVPIVQFPLSSNRPANTSCDRYFDRPLFAREIAPQSPCAAAVTSFTDRPAIVWQIASQIAPLIAAASSVDRTTVACVAAADRFAQRKARAGWGGYTPPGCSIGGGSLLSHTSTP